MIAVPGLVAATVCGLAGLLVPLVIARIPEVDQADEPGPRDTFAHVADLPGLALRSAGVSAVAGGLVGWSVGGAWPLLYLLPLVPVSVALAVVDQHTRLLPTWLVARAYVGLVALVLVVGVVTRDYDDLLRAGLGWLVAGGVFWLLWWVHPRGLGYGDVRLAGLLGLALGYLGWGSLVVGLYAGFLLLALPGLVLAVVRRDRSLLGTAHPFGPFLLVGALVGVVVGETVLAGLVAG